MYLGSGVEVSAISRVYDAFLGQQTNQAQAMASQADSTAQLTGQINSLFSDTTTGLGAAVDNFFTQIQALTASPGTAATRQTALSAAQEMAGQFNNYYAQLQSMSQSAQQQLGQEVSSVNTTVAQIASLNDQISLASATGGSPNSLLDQRDQDILTLNQAIGVTTTTQSNGSINVFLANGQPLLVGDKTYALSMGQDPVNPQNVVVGTSNGGTIVALDPNNSGGGAIGALLQFQTQTVPSVENQIGQLAVTLSSQFNAVQAQGVDQNGNPGTNFFSTPAITVTAASANTDAGTLSLTANYSNVTQLQASNYQLSVARRQLHAHASCRRKNGSSPRVWSASLATTPVTADGMTLNFSATPANGDVFTIAPVQLGAANLSVALTQGAADCRRQPFAGQCSVHQRRFADSRQPRPAGADGAGDPNPNLLQPVTLTFSSPTQYTYTYTPASGPPSVTPPAQTYTPGQAININGWSTDAERYARQWRLGERDGDRNRQRQRR